MARILVIAPYPGLQDIFHEVNQTLKKDIHVEVGDLHQGLTIAKSLENAGFDVIISRGATARLLREHCNLPVVEVKISGYDILRSLTLVKGYTGKIGLMSYLNTIQGADAIGTLIGMNLTFFPIDREQEIESGINEALAQGVQVIIGDVITTSIAAQMGLNTILITSGREAVLESILEAEHMAYYTKKEREVQRFFAGMIDTYQDGIVAVDNQGKICVFNRQAEELFGINADYAIGRLAIEVHSLLQLESIYRSGLSRTDEVTTLNGEKVLIHKTPVRRNNEIVGAMLVLQPAGKLQKAEAKIRQSLSNQNQAMFHFNNLVANSPLMKETVKQAKQYAKTSVPLIIFGEPGTGKQTLAQAIHNDSDRKNMPFVFVNCEAHSEEQLNVELFGSEEAGQPGVFELAHGGTVFIDAIGNMPLSIQAKLINVLQEGRMSRADGTVSMPVDVRLIAAHRENLLASVQSGQFREDLYHLLNGGCLSIPALRERKEDIEELVRWFIISYNSKFGKQIVGCKREVLQMLQEADWPGNVLELKTVVERMCLAVSGPFIEEAVAKPILTELNRQRKSASERQGFDIKGKTLADLEREIIMRVLEETDYNQSLAAKQLGINRSTLWRKVKEYMKS